MQVRFRLGILCSALLMAATGCHAPMARTGAPLGQNYPPAEMMRAPGPGVAGPGPGVVSQAGGAYGVAQVGYQGPAGPMGGGMMGGQAMGGGMMGGPAMGGRMMGGPGMMGGQAGMPGQNPTVQVEFRAPERMQISWDTTADGKYDSTPLVVPDKQNFTQGGVYRLKISHVESREGREFYPTLEIASGSPRTSGYLAHTSIPIEFTDIDFTQAIAGNYVTKVIYIPDPENQDLAVGGIETLVSTRLDPGVDPIKEADRRGAILAIVRLGNKDMEEPGTTDNAPSAFNHGGGVGGHGGQYISGMTGPAYGIPSVGTPIGLPGPPHIPMGAPAGLRNYTMTNHTSMQIPRPAPRFDVHVKQNPGFSMPRPATRAVIINNGVTGACTDGCQH